MVCLFFVFFLLFSPKEIPLRQIGVNKTLILCFVVAAVNSSEALDSGPSPETKKGGKGEGVLVEGGWGQTGRHKSGRFDPAVSARLVISTKKK